MNEHETQFIDTFIVKEKRARYHLLMGKPKRRSDFLECLNHNHDLAERFSLELPSKTDVPKLLREHGSPDEVYVISGETETDAKLFPLAQAVEETELHGMGTIISCIPGKLAYYHGEDGERRVLLVKK